MEPRPDNVFAGLSLSLDRVAERRDDAHWVQSQAQLASARYLLIDPTGRALLQAAGESMRWLDPAERAALLPEAPCSLMGRIGEEPYFLLRVDESSQAALLAQSLDATWMSLREVGLNLPALEAGLFAYAKGLVHWQRETRHCAFCGAPLQLVSSGHRAQCGNPDCARMHFPRTDAAIIVIVEHQGRCLLGRQAGWPPGRYSTLAGFVEPGESLEDAVRREVAEESGVIVDTVQYHSSQPWPMPASLMLGFTATARTTRIERRDRELEDARWFSPQEIVSGLGEGSFGVPPALSVSYQLLAHWLRERAGIELGDVIETARP